MFAWELELFGLHRNEGPPRRKLEVCRVGFYRGEPEHVDDVVFQWDFLNSIKSVSVTFKKSQTAMFIRTGKKFCE